MNTIETILYLAQQAGTPLALNADDGNFYICRERGGEVARLSPISEPSQTFANFEPARVITLANISDLQRYCNGIATDEERLYNDRETVLQRDVIGITTEAQRTGNGIATDAERELIGEGKVNLPPFSDTCPGEVADVARNIETLLRRAIDNTNKPATIENLMKIHRQAAQFAAAANIYKLNQIEQRLRGIVAKQGAIKTSEQTLARRRRRRMLFWKVAIAVLIFTTAAFYIYNAIKPRPSPQSDVATTERAASPTPPPSALAAAFEEWERETGRRIYPAGRECIERAAAAAGVIDNKEAIKKIIYKNVK